MKKLLLFALLFSGCMSVASKNAVKNRHAQYGIEPLPAVWKNKPFKGAELFYEHQEADASIYLNSQCKKVSDSPLEALTSQALVGMGRYEIVKQDPIKMDDREGLVSEVKVKLDGVERFIKIMVLRKNRCVFDAVFSAEPKSAHLAYDFDEMLKTFWAKADL